MYTKGFKQVKSHIPLMRFWPREPKYIKHLLLRVTSYSGARFGPLQSKKGIWVMHAFIAVETSSWLVYCYIDVGLMFESV